MSGQIKKENYIKDKAAELAEQYIQGNPEVHPMWEVEGDGIDDAEEDARVDVKE